MKKFSSCCLVVEASKIVSLIGCEHKRGDAVRVMLEEGRYTTIPSELTDYAIPQAGDYLVVLPGGQKWVCIQEVFESSFFAEELPAQEAA